MTKKAKILLAEDELNFGAVLESYLRLAKFEVDWCKHGKEAFSKLKNYDYDLCILDVMMPEMDGFTLAKEIKSTKSDLPFIFLTAKSMKEDVLKGFKLGADDYLTKPFDSEILIEKIKVILRKKEDRAEHKIKEHQLGNYIFTPHNRILKIGDEEKRLSPKESALLEALCLSKGGVLTRADALNKIWGDDNYFTARSMDVYIAKLRKYLARDPKISVINIHGNGFELNIED
ncbi:MAG: DNA-binding response regulator [Flavobacteriales bacterium]|nr:DNA-binding response regulator [Flavobacteriales bacterium]